MPIPPNLMNKLVARSFEPPGECEIDDVQQLFRPGELTYYSSKIYDIVVSSPPPDGSEGASLFLGP